MRNITIAMTALAACTAVASLLPQQAMNSGREAHALVLPVARLDLDLGTPPIGWDAQDPADPIWRAGREAINKGEWQGAAEQFRRIRTERAFRTSTYRGQSFYWEAFARSKMGGSAQLRQAQALLEEMIEEFPEEARKIRDVESLMLAIEGNLSRNFGDQGSAARLRESAGQFSDGCPDMDDDNNPRAAALHALLQMNTDDALPILEKIVLSREKCSEQLRAQAIWMLAQKKSPRSADLLLQIAKSDPHPEVRGQAVFWLSQVDSDRAIAALESILQDQSADEELYGNALFALSQVRSPRAVQLLRSFAMRKDITPEARTQAIHWLGQSPGADNLSFMKDLYAQVGDTETREMILHAVAQSGGRESGDWLLSIAMNRQQEAELRKQALFWYAQASAASGNAAETAAKLVKMYDDVTDDDLKEQLIFAYSQNGTQKSYVDKLMDIARTERNTELRTQAIFWLGQVGSKDPRVAKFLVDLINGN